MRIGEVATKSGVSVRALRYYEEQGLLTSDRSASGQRQYRESAIERVRLVQQLYAAGLTSRDIVELIPCVYTGLATPEMVTVLTKQRDRIDQQVAELTEARAQLDGVITTAMEHTIGQPVGAARP